MIRDDERDGAHDAIRRVGRHEGVPDRGVAARRQCLDGTEIDPREIENVARALLGGDRLGEHGGGRRGECLRELIVSRLRSTEDDVPHDDRRASVGQGLANLRIDVAGDGHLAAGLRNRRTVDADDDDLRVGLR